MNRHRPVALCLTLVALLLAGCVATASKAPVVPSGTDQPELRGDDASLSTGAPPLRPGDGTAAAQFHILTGEMAASRDQPALAAVEFLAALETQPDAALAARATGLALAAGDARLSARAAQRWLEIDASSLDAREVLLRVAVVVGDGAAALEQAHAITSAHPGGGAEGYRHVALLLSQGPSDNELPLRLMGQLAADAPQEPAAHYGLGIVALRYGQLDLAERSARAAAAMNAKSVEYGLLLTGVLVREKKLAESDTEMERLVKLRSGPRDELRLSYTKLLLEADERDTARRQLQRLVKESPDNPDARYALAVLALGDGETAVARKLFESLLKNPDRGKDAAFQLGLIAERDGNAADALRYYESVTSGNQVVDAAVRRAALLARSGRLAEARALLAQLRTQFPPLSAKLTQAEGEILLDAGQSAEALRVFEQALAQEPGHPQLLYARSIVYERMGRAAEAEADLRAVLAQDPEDASALNALGYLLTVHSTRYEEAEQLIRKALDKLPDDAAVIDSMGWVQFKQGRPEQALPLLQRAYEQTADVEVGAHYGEVLWALGRKDEARKIWAESKAREPQQPVLTETMRRLDP